MIETKSGKKIYTEFELGYAKGYSKGREDAIDGFANFIKTHSRLAGVLKSCTFTNLCEASCIDCYAKNFKDQK